MTASNEFASPKLRSSVLVTITVIENKNYAPVFDQDQYSFNVSEDAEIGTTVGNVSASDINEVRRVSGSRKTVTICLAT